MIDEALVETSRHLLALCRLKTIKIATAESCTGGLIAAALTAVAGSSDVFERGFVTYSNEAKSDLLGVAPGMIVANGAVSAEVAAAMAQGAVRNSNAQVSVAVTGVAGPGGGSEEKPVGLVHLATCTADGALVNEVQNFGNIGRETIRLKTVEAALAMLRNAVA